MGSGGSGGVAKKNINASGGDSGGSGRVTTTAAAKKKKQASTTATGKIANGGAVGDLEDLMGAHPALARVRDAAPKTRDDLLVGISSIRAVPRASFPRTRLKEQAA